MAYVGTRYFNGMDASIFINGQKVEEAVSLEFTETQQKMRIHGYKSVTWDAVLLGEAVIQGILVINFTEGFKLNEYLNGTVNVEKNSPPVKGRSPVTRNETTITIKYSKEEFAEEQLGTNIGWNNRGDKQYILAGSAKTIELSGVVFTNTQQSLVADASNVLEYSNFIARRVH